jgi:hypothetical protein
VHQSTVLTGFLLIICSIVSLVGIFQLDQLIGLAIYSNDFSVNLIETWQVGLIGAGIWGVSEFVRTIKKLKNTPSTANNKTN